MKLFGYLDTVQPKQNHQGTDDIALTRYQEAPESNSHPHELLTAAGQAEPPVPGGLVENEQEQTSSRIDCDELASPQPNMTFAEMLIHPTTGWLVQIVLAGIVIVGIAVCVVYWNPDQSGVRASVLIPGVQALVLWAVTGRRLMHVESLNRPWFSSIIKPRVWFGAAIPVVMVFVGWGNLLMTTAVLAILCSMLAAFAIIVLVSRMRLLGDGMLAPATIFVESGFHQKKDQPGMMTRLFWDFEVQNGAYSGSCYLPYSSELAEYATSETPTVLYLPKNPRRSIIHAQNWGRDQSGDPRRISRLDPFVMWPCAMIACILILGAVPAALVERHNTRHDELGSILAIDDDCAFKTAWRKLEIDSRALRYQRVANRRIDNCERNAVIRRVLSITDDCKFATKWLALGRDDLTAKHDQIAVARINSCVAVKPNLDESGSAPVAEPPPDR